MTVKSMSTGKAMSEIEEAALQVTSAVHGLG